METPRLVQKEATFEIWQKPSGWTVHNEAPSMLEFLKKQNASLDLHFLNRLDRETSGLVLITRQASNVSRLQELWNHPQTRKFYVGIHRKKKDMILKETIWSLPLSDKSEGRKNPQGMSKDRVDCKTIMRPLIETNHLFLSLLRLETGRQHQIRKHSALAGCELIGDTRYGDPKYLDRLKAHILNLRLGLHAHAIQLGGSSVVISQLPDFFSTVFPDCEKKIRDEILFLIENN